MAFYTMIGFVVVAAIVAVGVYWVLTNVTFNRPPDPYTYERDEHGNERVKDNTEDEPDAKA